MPNAAQRNAAQKKVAKAKNKTKAAEPVQETPVNEPEEKATAQLSGQTKVRGKSIRGVITQMIRDGASTEQITEVVVTEFPGTMAAAKPNKHIAFYRSRLKADAKKANDTPAAPAPAVVEAKAGSAKTPAPKKGK